MHRLFVAIQPPGDILEEVCFYQQTLRVYYGGKAPIRWVPKEEMHVTLNFLGTRRYEDLLMIRECIEKQVVSLNSVLMSERLLALPHLQRPRVIAISFHESGGELCVLQALLEESFAEMGIEPARHAWMPHITLGRVGGALKKPWPKLDFPRQDFSVRQLVLFESVLTPHGATYTALDHYPRSHE